jgi:hypothetical protein
MNNELITLINKISTMNGNNLLEKIVDYCETYDQDPQEIGDILESSDEFKKLLYKDCVKSNIIRDLDLEINDDLDVW